MMIQRNLQNEIEGNLFKGKVMIQIGPRQVGKTTLLPEILKRNPKQGLWLNADEGDIRAGIENAETSTQLLQLFGHHELIVIDEAQQIEGIGLKLKLLVDTKPEVQVIATGCSSFELLQKSTEPLTGRKLEFNLFPLSYGEMQKHTSPAEERRLLETRMLYGYYPEVINNPGKEKDVLKEIVQSYLYRDLLRFDGIKNQPLLKSFCLLLNCSLVMKYRIMNYRKGWGILNRRRLKSILIYWKNRLCFINYLRSAEIFEMKSRKERNIIFTIMGYAIPS